MVFYYFNSVNEFRYSLMENVQMDHRHMKRSGSDDPDLFVWKEEILLHPFITEQKSPCLPQRSGGRWHIRHGDRIHR